MSSTSGMVYRWVCPLCGESNVGTPGHTNARASARKALESHIRSCDGEGHGAHQEVPERYADAGLGAYIEVIE